MKTKASITTHVGTDISICSVEQRETGLRHVLQLLLATAREIFDESAYQRFLTHHHLKASRGSYSSFLKDQETRKARQPKCC